MISVQNLRIVISESQSLPQTPIIQRDNYLTWLNEASKSKLVIAIIGFRRSGKSYLLKMLTKELVARNIPHENVFYLNFENDLLQEVKTVKELREIWEIYLRAIVDLNNPIYIIWDEIQLVKNWEKLVRTIYEQGKYNIFLSGSNSQLLSGELSSSLSGRSLQLEVLPFSFTEYLNYRNIKGNYYQNRNEIDQAFTKYLKRGGIAEQFDLSDDLAKNYQEGLIQKIILDDIVKRYQIDKINILKESFDFIRGNITSMLSLRKIISRLEDQALKISPSTLDNYIYYWQTAYAINKVTRFDSKLSKIFDRTAKYYVIDNLLINGREEADEKRLENLVYVELVRRYGRENINFQKDENGYEIDFIVKKGNKHLSYQVCLYLTDNNAKRETRNTESMVLTLNDTRTNKNKVNIKPVVEWLLENGKII